MGIDIHGLNFLKYVRKFGPMGNIVTIGRQGVHIGERHAPRALGARTDIAEDQFAERLFLEFFGAETITALDHSPYQQAELIQDMNVPLAAGHHGRFDTVIDGGTLEHVFNLPQALMNCSLLCRPGGQIVHILPANNACGHGFWQFSPELFFSLYSAANGYARTEVYLVDTTDPTTWYKVRPPSSGRRANIVSVHEVYALVRTVRIGEAVRHDAIQQSDYIHEWSQAAAPAAASQLESVFQRAISPFPALRRALGRIRRGYANARALRRFNRESRLDRNNAALIICQVDALI